eukprot:gene6330-8716_t
MQSVDSNNKTDYGTYVAPGAGLSKKLEKKKYHSNRCINIDSMNHGVHQQKVHDTKSTTNSLSPPPSLQAVLKKIKENEPKKNATQNTNHINKELNRRLLNSLFISRIDTEELSAVVNNIDKNSNVNNNQTNLNSTYPNNYNSIINQLNDPSVIAMAKMKQSLGMNANNINSVGVTSSQGNRVDLSKATADKYFGANARLEFFNHYKKMSSVKHTIQPSSNVNDDFLQTFNSHSSSKSLENTTDHANVINDEIQTNRFFGPMESMLLPSQRLNFKTIASKPHSKELRINRSELNLTESTDNNSFLSQTINNSTLSLSLSDSFFDDLQSEVSHDEWKRAVDLEILTHDGFKTMKTKSISIINDKQFRNGRRKFANKLVPIVRKTSHNSGDGNTAISAIESPSILLFDNNSKFSHSNNTVQHSPRTKYLSGCIREGLCPLPNLILRKDLTTEINLSHYGIGDKMGKVLAECIHLLPAIEKINLKDNNLTDDSLQFLIDSIIAVKSLRDLDLSRNKIDGASSDSLAEYVSRPDCPLIRLTLQSADVDDGECDRFVQNLVSNKKLLELDLSSNLLGSAETMSSGDPNIRTGGEAIALFISSKSCRLQVLKLAWNSIRLNSAIKLTSALALNSTITYLDLSSNGLGWAAGEVMGDSILENKVLKTLIVSNNNFTSTSCLSICVGMTQNLAMKSVNINENPIGPIGAKTIMQISIEVGSRVNISAANCNTIATDSRCWYDPSQPCREYELNLDKPYDRAVAFHVLHVVATHSTFILVKSEYEAPGVAVGRGECLELVQIMMSDKEQFFDEEQANILKGLRFLQKAAANEQLGTKLFYQADTDGSGKLDKEELKVVLDDIGFHIDEERLQDIMSVFDVDGTGEMDLHEFLSLLRSQNREAASRIKDMVEYPIMALKQVPDRKYIPPRKGILRFKVIDGFVTKENYRTVSTVDQKYAYQMAKGIGDMNIMTEAFKNSKIRYSEALNMYRSMFKESGDKIEVLKRVLPQMLLANEAMQLVSKVTQDDRLEINRLKKAFGVALRPIFGSFNGYYMLDLSKELDRVCLVRLIEQSETSNNRRALKSIHKFGKFGDTSQMGNWSSFRNEIFNGKRMSLTASMFNPMPKSGLVEFDFSNIARPHGDELRIDDKKIIKVLQNICLLPVEATSEYVTKLAVWKKKVIEKNRDKTLFMPAHAISVQKAREIGLCSDDFYDELLQRSSLIRKGMRKEEIKVNFMRNASSSVDSHDSVTGSEERMKNNDNFAIRNNEDEDQSDGQDAVNEDLTDNGDYENDDDSQQHLAGNANQDDDQNLSGVETEADLKKRRIVELRIRLQTLLNAGDVSKHAKASRFVEVVEETFSNIWLLSRHLCLIIVLFKQVFADLGRSSVFGSYAVDIVVLLFPRVIDLHNIEILYEVLSFSECSCVFNRLGLLNLFNPAKPETTLELSLDRMEERLVAKMIIYLSVAEPGVNLTFKSFQWKREWDPIPGWEVTESWMTNEGLPTHGKFIFTFYSGEGKGKLGCSPDLLARHALMQLVLLDENELITEDEFPPDVPNNSAVKHYKKGSNADVWENYLLNRVNPDERH